MSVRAGSRRERNKQAVRSKINRATVRLIQSRGIDSVTVENICQRADVARMTFYNYYSSRHELLDELCRAELLNPVSDQLHKVAASQATFSMQIRQLLRLVTDGFNDLGPLQRELIVYMIDNFSSSQDDGDNQLDTITDTLEHFYERHQQSIKPGLGQRFCALATVGAMTGILTNWLNFDDYELESRLDTLADFLVDSFVQI